MSIKVEHIQTSVCKLTGERITTLVAEYPRIIHSQLLTHRVFTRNGSSTRAVPINTSIQNIKDNPVKFIWTGKKPGMQGSSLGPEDSKLKDQAELVHIIARENAFITARTLDALGIHKQHAGRYLETFQNIRVCITSTEWENWDWLRIDADSQPEITELAEKIYKARTYGTAVELSAGEMHVPFVGRKRNPDTGELEYFELGTDKPLTKAEAINVSMSASAQTSYRKNDTSLEKAEDMHAKLFAGKKVHASPSEHQASPIGAVNNKFNPEEWPEGVTHVDRDSSLWSGNFKNFIQNRQLIPNHDGAKLTY